jgi:molybdenum cofactor biosynthesis enzyme MoaA
MYEIGLSTPGFINEQLFANMAEAGIKHIEISVDKGQSDALDYGKLKE